MKCIFCTEDIPDGSLFCPVCGKALPREVEAVKEPAPSITEETLAIAKIEEVAGNNEAKSAEDRTVQKQQVVFPGRDIPVNYFEEAAAKASEAPYGAPVRRTPRKEFNSYAVASLVTALVNAVCFMCLGIPFSAAGVIFAVLGLKSEKRGMSIAALILNGVCVLIGCILLISLMVIGVRYSAQLY